MKEAYVSYEIAKLLKEKGFVNADNTDRFVRILRKAMEDEE